ncbi:nucleotide-sugar transporter [Morchella conica CCBAS932]|uniref:Nucleotide-sugar transporter n=1 Tax=Morchella conica CCBAS932 TaxID=1392247 RepID=A0A3N4L1N3_9PEZI|nr:nucleotide-sugar transporter [Morchella conica CCBAS932]
MVAETPEVPSFMGVPMKHLSLVTLTFQNSALILIMHYSRIMPMTSQHRYFTSTAVFLNEVIKLAICVWVALRDRRKIDGPTTMMSQSVRQLYTEVFRPDNWKLAIPACLYTLQNTLQYVAVSNLDAATFQVTYQLKILTTALFSVTMLHRGLSLRKWVSLVLLTIGVAIVQLPSPGSSTQSQSSGSTDASHQRRSAPYDGTHSDNSAELQMNRAVGLFAVAIACTISGLAGVYFEKVLKGSSATLWVRNIQLSFYSLFPAFFIGVVFVDGSEIMRRGFFDGYNGVVWTAIAFQAAGGIVVALCVNFADNIAKNFATSISILISCLASVYFFDFEVTINFMIGSGVVLLATWLYSKPESNAANDYIPLEKTEVETVFDNKEAILSEDEASNPAEVFKRQD